MKKFLLLFFTLITLGISQKAEATHMMGADFEFACLGNDSFLIRVKVYKDCRGISLSPIQLDIDGKGCSYSKSYTMSQISCEDVTPVCKSGCSKCDPQNCNAYGYPNGSNANCNFNYGCEKVVFEQIVDLSGTKCCKFIAGYSQSARNGAINTCCASETFYSFAEIDKCISPCNTSPVLSNDPVAIYCAGQDVCFNNGARDTVDYDSLSYSLSEALNGPNSPCSYSGSYTYKKPLYFLGFPNAGASLPSGFHLDTVTGDLCFRPMQQQTAVIVIEITEWRKDSTGTPQIIGVTHRDMQIIIMANCNNRLPTLSGPYSYNVCAGDQLCFDIKTDDKDTKDTTRIDWNYGIPKGTFSENNGTVKRAKGTFCWTPTDDDVSSVPWTFTAKVWDDACPINGSNSKSYSVLVKPRPQADRTYTNLTCGQVQMECQPYDSYSSPVYEWEVPYPGGKKYGTATATHQFSSGGKWPVKFSIENNGCKTMYIDTIDVPPFVTANIGPDTFVCYGGSYTMNCSVTDGDPPFIYNWYTQFPGDTSFTQSTADSGNTSFTMQPFNDYNIMVKVTDNQGCVSTDTVHLVVKPNPVISLGPDQRVCRGIPVMLDAGDNNGNGAAGYLWSTGATTRTISVTDSNTYYCKIIDSTGCFKMDTVDVFVNEMPPVYAGPDVNGCPNDTFYIPASGAQSYTWYDLASGNVISTDTILPFYGPKGTTATYVLQGDMTIGGVTCTSYDTVSAVIADLPTLVFPQLRRCEDWPQINLYVQDAYYMINGTKVADQGSATFSSSTNPSSISGSILYPPIAGGTSATNPNMVVVNYTTQYGCTIIDSFQVLIDPLPATDIDIRNFCEADADFKLTGTGYPQGAGTVNETWSGTGVYLNGSDYYFSPSSAGTGSFLVTYEFKTTQGCKKSDTATYFVRPIPHITYTDPADICLVDGPQNLFNMTGAQPNYGTWQWVSAPSGSLDGTTGDYIPTVAGSYNFAYVVAAGSCKDSINITLNVNPTPTVTMPSSGTFCITDPPVALSISNPGNTTGYWEIDGDSVKGVSGTFDPSIGAGIHYCTYVYYDILTGCKNRDSITMSVTPQPTVSITPSAAVCQGDSIPLIGTFQNAQGIQWTSATGGRFTNDLDTNAWYIPSSADIAAGTVTLTLTTTGNGYCQAATATQAYTINPTPIPDFTIDDSTGCSPHLVNFGANAQVAGTTYTWNFGDPESGADNTATGDVVSHLFVNPTAFDKTYDITLTAVTPAGCDTTIVKPMVISAYPNPFANFVPEPGWTTTALPKFRFNNLTGDVEGGLQYLWEFGDLKAGTSTERSPVYTYTSDTGTYWVHLQTTTIHNCWDTITKPVTVGPDISVFIPNAFTPDPYGPTRNNRFYVTANSFKDFEIYIFNRWGEILYRSNDINDGWDGNYKGEPCQIDVYVYEVIISDYAGKKYRYNGNVHLLR